MKKKIKVAVVYNEPNPEYYIKEPIPETTPNFKLYFEVEEFTPMEEYDQLAEAMGGVGLNTYTLNIEDNLQFMLDDFKKNKPDVIFNFVEIFKDEARYEMNVVGIYELLGIPYTGAPALALANCQSKILAKRLLQFNKIETSPFKVIRNKAKRYSIPGLRFPLIVKPAFEDASVGIENESIVRTRKELQERIDYVLTYFLQPALVEEFIEGRELNVAVMGDTRPNALPISEIDFSRMPDHLHNIVSYQAKWDPHHESYHKTIPICPAKLPKRIEEKAKKIAIRAFRTMGCRDYARVDMRLSRDNELYVLEVNPNPDLTEGAGFMRSAHAAGYSYAMALKKIAMYAYKRGVKIRN